MSEQPLPSESIGFTATRHGMDQEQRHQLRKKLLSEYRSGMRWFHHGDCVGGDAEAHVIAREIGYLIAVHPPTHETYRAFMPANYYFPARPYLERNGNIVDRTKFLIAGPQTDAEQLRSGTWATVRYARRRNKFIFMLHRGSR